jgi:hypothetical protein
MKSRVKLAGCLLALGILAILAGFTKVSAPGPKAGAIKLLDESYSLLNQIDSSNRVFYLLPLTQAGAKIGSSHEEEWCKQMFQESFNVRDPWDRVALEKNALVALSFVNASAAMELFWRIEAPMPDARGTYPEDVRADGASTIFPNYLDAQIKGIGTDGSVENRLQTAIGEIQRHAAHIGKTGDYPYRAMGTIIQRLDARKDHQSTINLIFAEAVKFYSEGKPKFRNRDAEFLALLQSAINAGADPSLVNGAMSLFVKNLRAPVLPNDVSFEAEYRTPQGEVIKLTDRNKALLLRAASIIRKADPKLAKSMAEEYAEFSKATDGMTYISGGVVEGIVDPQQAAAMHAKMRQISLLALIQAKPLQSKQFIDELSDNGMRLVGRLSLIAGLMQVDPVAARAIYADQRTQLQEMADNAQRLRGIVALAKAASSVKDESDFKSLTDRAIEQGAELYREDYRQRPDLRPDLHSGYSELREIIRFATAHNLNWTIDRIRSIQNVELRAHLLVFAAEGVAEQSEKVS